MAVQSTFNTEFIRFRFLRGVKLYKENGIYDKLC